SAAQRKADLERALVGAKPGEEREIRKDTYITMFRQGATAPAPGGWQLAQSTKGGFSVELPLPFNDFRLRAKADDGVELRTDSVGAKSPGQLSWMATCVTRADGKIDPKAKVPTADKTESLGTPVRAWQRTIPLDGKVCVLVVEAQGRDPLPP